MIWVLCAPGAYTLAPGEPCESSATIFFQCYVPDCVLSSSKSGNNPVQLLYCIISVGMEGSGWAHSRDRSGVAWPEMRGWKPKRTTPTLFYPDCILPSPNPTLEFPNTSQNHERIRKIVMLQAVEAYSQSGTKAYYQWTYYYVFPKYYYGQMNLSCSLTILVLCWLLCWYDSLHLEYPFQVYPSGPNSHASFFTKSSLAPSSIMNCIIPEFSDFLIYMPITVIYCS